MWHAICTIMTQAQTTLQTYPPPVAHPNQQRIERAIGNLNLWRWLTQPVCSGLDNIPNERPLLFVGNHTLYGMLDAPIMLAELYERRNIVMRGLGHHMHFAVPGWRALMSDLGMVHGTRANCAHLMRQGAAILVFPGGDREVSKRRGEKYQLIWNNRTGFARMALAHQCTIIPFGSVGIEDAFDIRLDANDLLATRLGRLMVRCGVQPKMIPPIATGIGPTPLPRPHRLYFHFGQPIRTVEFGDDPDDLEAIHALRDTTKNAIEQAIGRMRRKSDADPNTTLTERLTYALKRRLR
ncbi:MAG: lysophospholipid acyltransferase family protein, partial [Myxococcota bacterium]